MSEIIEKDMIIIAVSPLNKNMSVVTVTLWTIRAHNVNVKYLNMNNKYLESLSRYLKGFPLVKRL